MVYTGLHPLGGKRPHRAREIELRPGGSTHFAGTRGGEHRKLKRQTRGRIAENRTQTRERATDLRVRQISVVNGRRRHPRQH